MTGSIQLFLEKLVQTAFAHVESTRQIIHADLLQKMLIQIADDPVGKIRFHLNKFIRIFQRIIDDLYQKTGGCAAGMCLREIAKGCIFPVKPFKGFLKIIGVVSGMQKMGSLVISKNVSPVKMAIASVKEGNKILANGNLYVIELDEDKINPYFLKAYLESENGKAALSRVAVGATLLNLPVEGLKKITIPLPDLKSQKIIADKYYAKINEIKELKYKLEKATAELEHIYTEEQ